MTKNKTLLIYLGLAATALLSLLPFFGVGFTTGDDFQYFNTARQSWKYWMNDAKIYAEGAGRFYFYITKVFYYVPYLVDSFAYTKVVQYITLLACYGMFAYLVYRLFHSRNLSLLTFLLLVFDTTLTLNNHIATIAYPFYFTFSIIIFIAALLLYLDYAERGGYWRVIVSALLFLVAYLFYETYLLFALVFGALVVLRHLRRDGVRLLRSRDFWRETLPYVFTALVYVGCYWGYRQYLLATVATGFYDGASFSMDSFSIDGFFKVLWRCTREAVPGRTYVENIGVIADNSLLLSGHRNILFRVLTNAPAIVWVNALLQGVLLWMLTRPEGFKRLHGNKLLAGIVISLLVAFFAHTLIGIATKYNLDWCDWMLGYVTTIYSILGLMLALALVVAASVMLCHSQWWHRAVRMAWCLLIVVFSVIIGYANHHISREWQRCQHRMDLVDMIGKSGYFSTLPDNAVLYTEELRNTSWQAYDISKESMNMEYYIDNRAGRQFNYVTDSADLATVPANRPLYYVHAIETKKACELLIAFAKLDSVRSSCRDSLHATEADVFYYSPCKKYTVFYQAAGVWKSVSYDAGSHNKKLTQTTLADSAISPNTIVVSDMVLPQ